MSVNARNSKDGKINRRIGVTPREKKSERYIATIHRD